MTIWKMILAGTIEKPMKQVLSRLWPGLSLVDQVHRLQASLDWSCHLRCLKYLIILPHKFHSKSSAAVRTGVATEITRHLWHLKQASRTRAAVGGTVPGGFAAVIGGSTSGTLREKRNVLKEEGRRKIIQQNNVDDKKYKHSHEHRGVYLEDFKRMGLCPCLAKNIKIAFVGLLFEDTWNIGLKNCNTTKPNMLDTCLMSHIMISSFQETGDYWAQPQVAVIQPIPSRGRSIVIINGILWQCTKSQKVHIIITFCQHCTGTIACPFLTLATTPPLEHLAPRTAVTTLKYTTELPSAKRPKQSNGSSWTAESLAEVAARATAMSCVAGENRGYMGGSKTISTFTVCILYLPSIKMLISKFSNA